MAKVTFTLDDETIRTLRAIAQRRQKPQSLVVREAVASYAAQGEILGERERVRRLRVLDGLAAKAPTRAQNEVARELRRLRADRRAGWRRSSE